MKSFYDRVELYDAIHLPDTPSEAEGALAVILSHAPEARRLLEPACGTGRLLSYFAGKGYEAEGYDLNARQVAFARRRGARAVLGSMTRFARPAAFDAAYSLIGSFRHLLTEREALTHLRLTARSLRPGGVYVVGLDLVDYDANFPEEEGWEIESRGRLIRHFYATLPPDRRRRREKLMNFVTVGRRVLQDDYELRSYDAAQWRALIAKSPLRLAGVYDASGKPGALMPATRYALFALAKK